MKWTPAMLNTLCLEANAINRWRGWAAVAETVSRVHGVDISASSARQAYDRDCERYKRKTQNEKSKTKDGKETNE
jgi:hypothetical protein